MYTPLTASSHTVHAISTALHSWHSSHCHGSHSTRTLQYIRELLSLLALIYGCYRCEQFYAGPRAACLAISAAADAPSGPPPSPPPPVAAGGARVALCVAGAMRTMVSAGVHRALRANVVKALGVPVDTYLALDVIDPTAHTPPSALH